MVGRGGVEPPTSRLSGVRSNHLSYRPGAHASRFLQQREALESLPGRCASCEAHFPVMKGHEDGGICSLEGAKLFQPQGLTLSNPSLERRRSEEHTSELQSLMRISYAVFCLKKKKQATKLTKRKT